MITIAHDDVAPHGGEWSGRTVLVTGAGLGLGRAIALAFAAAGAKVFGADITSDGLAETKALATGADPRGQCPLSVSLLDVRDPVAVDGFVDAALAETGRVDALINNAGGICGQTGHPIDEVTDRDWQHILDVNVNGAFYCARAVVPAMRGAGFGRIVSISSSAGLSRTVTGIQSYAAAKAGLIGLTRQLSHELGPFGITVNSVAPSFVPCNDYALGRLREMGDAGRQAALEKISMRRFGKPDDVVHAVLFFASVAAGWITGQTLSVDGGT